MNAIVRHVIICILTTVLIGTADRAIAASAVVAIGGYSPVSYFTENRPERGNREFAVVHDGQTYYLTSRDQVELFEKDPERYRPRHRACTYSLALGMVSPLDPTNFKIVGDTLLLFHRSEEKDGLLEWNQSEISETELLRRADANVFLIEF